jgi:hypothetical protein
MNLYKTTRFQDAFAEALRIPDAQQVIIVASFLILEYVSKDHLMEHL